MIKIKWDWSLWYVANWFHFQDINPIQSTQSFSNWDLIDGKLLHSCVLIICSPFGRNRFETLLLCTLLQSACMPHDMSCFLHSIVDLVVLETGEFFGQDDRLEVVAFQLDISACSCSKFVRTVVYIYMSTVHTLTFDLTIYVCGKQFQSLVATSANLEHDMLNLYFHKSYSCQPASHS